MHRNFTLGVRAEEWQIYQIQNCMYFLEIIISNVTRHFLIKIAALNTTGTSGFHPWLLVLFVYFSTELNYVFVIVWLDCILIKWHFNLSDIANFSQKYVK